MFVFEVILVRMQSECGEILTRITLNTDTFCVASECFAKIAKKKVESRDADSQRNWCSRKMSVEKKIVYLLLIKLKTIKHSKQVKQSNEKKQNNKMISSKETTEICLFVTLSRRQINISKIFPEVINVCYEQRGTFFTDFELDCIIVNVKSEDFT